MEENFGNLNWVETSDISLIDDVFCAFGRLRDHSIYYNDEEPNHTTKEFLYHVIKEKNGKIGNSKLSDVTCVIIGDNVPKSKIACFNNNVKFIYYSDFQEWFSKARCVTPDFFEFRDSYCSSIDNRLRSYQQDAKNEIFQKWRSEKNVMLQMPTGAGKTMLFSSVIKDLISISDSNTLIITHRNELIEQIHNHLNRYNIAHGIIASGIKRNLNYNVQLASIQTLTHKNNVNITKEFLPKFIIIDEAHHTLAATYDKLWKLYPNSWKLGVTATPCRLNCSTFTNHFSSLIESKSIESLIDDNYLSDYVFYTENPTSKLSKAIENIKGKSSTGDYKIQDLLCNLNVDEYLQRLVLTYTKYAKGLHGIVYAISIEHALNICSAYKSIGVNAEFIDSKTNKTDRVRIIDEFKKRNIDVLVNVDIFTEGFDCPDVEFVQMARPTWSLSKYLQQVGRGLRPCKTKGKTIILDNAGMFNRFGLPS